MASRRGAQAAISTVAGAVIRSSVAPLVQEVTVSVNDGTLVSDVRMAGVTVRVPIPELTVQPSRVVDPTWPVVAALLYSRLGRWSHIFTEQDATIYRLAGDFLKQHNVEVKE